LPGIFSSRTSGVQQVVEKVIIPWLVKNIRMQGARNPEE
jgi:hypothetical protein